MAQVEGDELAELLEESYRIAGAPTSDVLGAPRCQPAGRHNQAQAGGQGSGCRVLSLVRSMPEKVLF